MSKFKKYIWYGENGIYSNDIDSWKNQLAQLANGWSISILGFPSGESLELWQRPSSLLNKPHKLIACGFHGEESAAPWGLIDFLKKTQPKMLDQVNLSLLPLVNVTGFKDGTRFNRSGENPNRGFMPHLDDVKLSAEGKVLFQHADLLDRLGSDGVLSCHEDVNVSCAYLYAYERTSKPSTTSLKFRDILSKNFDILDAKHIDGCLLQEGIVFNQIDGSFESWLFERGAKNAFCIETPGLMPFSLRVQSQSLIMQSFVEQ